MWSGWKRANPSAERPLVARQLAATLTSTAHAARARRHPHPALLAHDHAAVDKANPMPRPTAARHSIPGLLTKRWRVTYANLHNLSMCKLPLLWHRCSVAGMLEGNVTAESRPSSLAARMTTKLPAAGSTTSSPGLGDGTDQPRDQLNRFDVWVNCAVNFLRPAARDAMVSPRLLRGNRRLL
jgi:hypothetical protein